MDPADRKFSRNALRLELLTQEELQRCIEEQKQLKSRVSLREIALGLGLLNVKDAQRATSDDPAAPERPSVSPALRRKNLVVEEQGVLDDPRSEGAPPRPPRRTRAQTGKTAQSLAPVRPPTDPLAGVSTPAVRSVAPQPVNRRWEADSVADLRRQGAGERAALEVRGSLPPATPSREPPPIPSARPDAAKDPNARWLADASPPPVPSARPPTPGARPAVPSGQPDVSIPPPKAFPAPAAASALSNATVMFAPAPVVSFAPPEPPARVLTEPPPAPTKGAGATGAEPYLVQAVGLAIAQGASDLHLHSGAPLMIRVDGHLVPISGGQVLSPEAADHVVDEIMSDRERAELAAKGEIEFAWTPGAIGRCRVNAYRQQRGLDAVLRIIPKTTPKPSELGLPPGLARLVALRSGIVLCAGPAGSGKSTTLAALLAERIAARADHVVTLEAPIEHVLPEGRALVTQREVGPHSASFPRALRAALREDPDVIALTDLRDPETIELVLAAAESGRLVLATVAATSVRQALERVLTSCPSATRHRLRASWAESLRAVVVQHLLPRTGGRGRAVAVELLFGTDAVRDAMRSDAPKDLAAIMKDGREDGMLTLEDSLAELVREGAVDVEDARRFARAQAGQSDA